MKIFITFLTAVFLFNTANVHAQKTGESRTQQIERVVTDNAFSERFSADHKYDGFARFSNCEWTHPPIQVESQTACAEKNKQNKNVCSGVIKCTMNYHPFALPETTVDGFELPVACGADEKGQCLSPGKCGAASLTLKNPVFKNGKGEVVNGEVATQEDISQQQSKTHKAQ